MYRQDLVFEDGSVKQVPLWRSQVPRLQEPHLAYWAFELCLCRVAEFIILFHFNQDLSLKSHMWRVGYHIEWQNQTRVPWLGSKVPDSRSPFPQVRILAVGEPWVGGFISFPSPEAVSLWFYTCIVLGIFNLDKERLWIFDHRNRTNFLILLSKSVLTQCLFPVPPRWPVIHLLIFRHFKLGIRHCLVAQEIINPSS